MSTEPTPLEVGLVLGRVSHGALSEAPVVHLETRFGDAIFAATHQGAGYKPANEDRIAVAERGGTVSLFIVDGMGGHKRGDVAAQILAEELIRLAKQGSEETSGEAAGVIRSQIVNAVNRLPTESLAGRVQRALEPMLSPDQAGASPQELVQIALETVQLESMDIDDASEGVLHRIAEVFRDLAGLSPPDPVEVAIRHARERISLLPFRSDAPDACFVGAIVETNHQGRRMLDLKQVGDCKLFVCDREECIRFQSIPESMIPEPDLTNPKLSLPELMTYSLNRNFVTNSINSRGFALKQYRRKDIPLELHPGDRVFIYSDGVDDLFTPQELIRLSHGKTVDAFLSHLLSLSERRMRYVDRLLKVEKSTLGPDNQFRAYPAIHQRMNEARVANGCYVELYEDGSIGRWIKPPKCDNTAIAVLEIADPGTAIAAG